MAGLRNPGLAALADIARLSRAPPNGRDSASRRSTPMPEAGSQIDLGVRLLTTEDPDEAEGIAAEPTASTRGAPCDRNGGERGGEALSVTQGNRAVAIVAGPGWHPGVIGIVAGRLKEKLHKPAIVIALGEDGLGTGSGRSISGVDLGAAVLAAKDAGLLVAGGGHAMAAGLNVAADRATN